MKGKTGSVRGVLARVMGLAALAAIVCLTGALLARDASAATNRNKYVIVGTIESVDSAGNAITVKLSDGTEKTLQLAKRLTVNGREEKMSRAEPGLATQPRAVISYTKNGAEETAVEVESLNHSMRKTVTGSLVSADKATNTLVLQLANGRQKTFSVKNDAVIETNDSVTTFLQFEPQQGAQLTLHFEDALGVSEVSRMRR